MDGASETRRLTSEAFLAETVLGAAGAGSSTTTAATTTAAADARAVAPGAASSDVFAALPGVGRCVARSDAGRFARASFSGRASAFCATTFVLGAKKLAIERMPCVSPLGGPISARRSTSRGTSASVVGVTIAVVTARSKNALFENRFDRLIRSRPVHAGVLPDIVSFAFPHSRHVRVAR